MWYVVVVVSAATAFDLINIAAIAVLFYYCIALLLLFLFIISYDAIIQLYGL